MAPPVSAYFYEMKEPSNYSVVAQFYDEAYGQASDSSDIHFYLEAAKNSSGPILEIACGTGRILLPIAKSGMEIDGIDGSEAMLTMLKEKLQREAKLTYSPTLLRVDMRGFSTGKFYQLVTIPFRSLQHMITLEDKLRALTAAKSHLALEGRLVFDVAFPKFDVIAQGMGQEYLDSKWISAETGRPVEMYFFREEYRKVDQTVLGKLIFRTSDDSGRPEEYYQDLEMHFFSLPEIEALLACAGLEIESCYGNFDSTPLVANSSHMIFVARHAAQKEPQR